MKRWLILLFLATSCALAQNTPTIGVLPDNGPSLPAVCVIGQIYFRTATTIGLNQCNPANTWTALGTGSGTGTVNANSGIVGANAYYAAAGGSTTVSPSTGLSYDAVGNATLAQGTISVSTPILSHTGTWNAGGVAFTNWLSNITCTAAAANSIALGLGVGGTSWKFQYLTANCGNPQLTIGTGDATHMSIGTASNTGIWFSGTIPIIDNNGSQIMQFTSTGPSIVTGDLLTNPNCGANGTAANPSVVSCAAASAGSFSCATNASTGTCTVNTTVVTANSEIFITGRNDTTTGTRLGVTCNTGITTAIPEISAVVAATSFTINLGTFTTNPECFSYFIVN